MYRLLLWIGVIVHGHGIEMDQNTDDQLDKVLRDFFEGMRADKRDDEYGKTLIFDFVDSLLEGMKIPELIPKFHDRIQIIFDEKKEDDDHSKISRIDL